MTINTEAEAKQPCATYSLFYPRMALANGKTSIIAAGEPVVKHQFSLKYVVLDFQTDQILICPSPSSQNALDMVRPDWISTQKEYTYVDVHYFMHRL